MSEEKKVKHPGILQHVAQDHHPLKLSNTLDAKKYKWDNRFSKRRLKCKGLITEKPLKVYDICNNAARQ